MFGAVRAPLSKAASSREQGISVTASQGPALEPDQLSQMQFGPKYLSQMSNKST